MLCKNVGDPRSGQLALTKHGLCLALLRGLCILTHPLFISLYRYRLSPHIVDEADVSIPQPYENFLINKVASNLLKLKSRQSIILLSSYMLCIFPTQPSAMLPGYSPASFPNLDLQGKQAFFYQVGALRESFALSALYSRQFGDG